MRRINLLYLTVPLVAYALFLIYKGLNRNTASFYGVAENQETPINLEHSCTILNIHVTEGQFVTKGTLLMEVVRTDLEFKMSELNHDITELLAKDRLTMDEIDGKLERLRAERAEKIGLIQGKIKVLEAEQALNRALLEELTNDAVKDTTTLASSPYLTKLHGLQDELRLAVEPLDAEIAGLESMRKLSGVPVQTVVEKLKKEVALYEKEQEKLKIYAPSDGLIGNIHGHVGENISSFNTLISFYEENPNTVVAYLHESLSLQVKVGDTLSVTSSLHSTENCIGYVSGLGHRIIEIPERLRKIPEIKTYGREVLVSIPSENNFLQKEKVVLRHMGHGTSSLFSMLQPTSSIH